MGDVVETSSGRVRGRCADGLLVFSGIPYARSPAGALRWRAPQAPERWSGVRPATEPGPVAPQPPPTAATAVPGDPTVQDEGCLSLNVWTPALDDARRPVMVWVHGGSFTSGTGASLLYDGSRLARRGDVVVVTINYRLGALGFLGHPALLDGPAPTTFGNWGLQDQIAALRWVADHAAAFGGDPGNVTVFGESAGAMSVSCLLVAPPARGLFHKAVVQSGPPYTHSVERATKAGELLAGELGLREVSRRALERVPADELVAAQQAMEGKGIEPGDLPLPFLPVVDGVLLPRPPHEAVRDGEAANVPLLIGTNRDEMSLFALGDPKLFDIDEEGLVRWLERAAPGVPAERAIASYRGVAAARSAGATVRDVWVAMGSDLVFRWPSLRLASLHNRRQSQTYAYLFTWQTPLFGGLLGSCHALEIPFVFGGVFHPAIAAFTGGGREAEDLSERMQDAWLSFARTGDPSSGPVGRVPWEAWSHTRRSTMVFGPDGAPSGVSRGGLARAPHNDELAVWEAAAPVHDRDGVDQVRLDGAPKRSAEMILLPE